MSNKRIVYWLIGLALATLAVGALMAWVFPPYIQSLLQNPNDGYLCKILLKHQLKNPQRYTPEFYANFIPEVIIRILWLSYFTTAAVFLLFTKGRKYLNEFWNHRETAFNLGILRISTMYLFFIFDLTPLNSLIELRAEGMNIPTGYAFLKPMMPPPAWLVHGLWNSYIALVILVMVGFLTRVTVPLLAAIGFFVMLGPQLVGKMNHYHHLWIVVFLMCFTRVGDALSVDAWISKWRGKPIEMHTYDQRYGRFFVYLWLTMGAVYFFPGFWKFAAGGFDWAFSDNVQLKILAKIYETGEQPVIPLHNYPLLCKLGGLGTLVFELGFPFAMIFPKTRLLFGFGGIAFHEMNRRITQIGFTSIEFLYPSFIDWSALLVRGFKKMNPVRLDSPRWVTATSVFVVGMLYVTGITAIESWPWACYPTFAPLEQRFVNSIEMRLTKEPPAVESVLLQEDKTMIAAYNNRTRLRSYMNLVMTQPDEAERNKMLKSMFDLWQKDHQNESFKEIEFWQVQVPLLPLGAPPAPYKSLGRL